MEKTLNNEELIDRIRLGDEEAKSIFVKQNSPLVYSIVHRFGRFVSDWLCWINESIE